MDLEEPSSLMDIVETSESLSLETPFRLALLGIFFPTAFIGLYHRLRAASSGERVSHRDEGYVFAAVLRLCGLALWLCALAYLVYPPSVQFASIPLPVWLRWTGAPVGVLAIALAYWTLASLGKNLTDTVYVRSAATLVTHGPYRWVRHPFYVTAGMLILSVTLLTASWLIGLTGLLVITLLVVRTPKEEQMLIHRFGQKYRDYITRTGRFFPRPPSRIGS
jgi:protein-S-isoprenylcysteine O-methyltransferase Ste14